MHLWMRLFRPAQIPLIESFFVVSELGSGLGRKVRQPRLFYKRSDNASMLHPQLPSTFVQLILSNAFYSFL